MKSARTHIIVITGASSGLGFEVARQLSARNTHVILTSRNVARGLAATERLRILGGNVAYHTLDVQDTNGIRTFAEYVQTKHGRVDVLINNAGAHSNNDGPGLRVTAATMLETFTSNCLGALLVTQGLSELLRISGEGQVINISTILASPGQMSVLPGQYFAYRIAKSALNAVTAGLAEELREHAVSVNAVHPGWLKTAMGGPHAPQPVEEGAARVMQLVLNLPANATGKFFVAGAEHPW